MKASDWSLGCALQNIAAEKAPGDRALTALVSEGFDSWVNAVADHLESCGMAGARSAALSFFCALEGARSLARASRSDAPFRAIADSYAKLLSSGAAS